MRLAIVIPTYNRSASLARTLRSILAARVPEGLEITVAAIDNRSTDDTRAVVEKFSEKSGGIVQYVPEDRNQGRSFALNTGIRKTESDLVGFVDDDEEIDENWLPIVASRFSDPKIDYIGGRYLPCWERKPPAWVNHPHTRTAIGWADFGDRARPYSDHGFDGLLIGGNCVLRRACFAKAGLYSNRLGRKGTRLFAGEDADMHERLIAAGLQGVYLPELVVYHHIPASRLTKRYMRRWAFWASASAGYMMRERMQSSPHLCGLPRYMYGNAARSPLRLLQAVVSKKGSAETFHCELALWRFAGTLYGRHLLFGLAR
ncbi:MAG: glycosyltransferase [Bryobacteraceae bacterium]